MATLSTQKINNYFEMYYDKEVAFNKAMIQVTGLETKKIFLKVRGQQNPCILYSSSMKAARIIINLTLTDFEEIKRANNYVSLRLAFFPKDSKSSIVFFVPCLVLGYNPFTKEMVANAANPYLVTLQFSQKPPDDLIEVLGKVIELSENFEKRKSLRINLDGKVIKDIGFENNKVNAVIDHIKRPAIIKNISAFGCMVILSCNPKFILNKQVTVEIHLSDYNETVQIEGVALRSEDVTGRKDIYGIGIQFHADKIPFLYKEILNRYIDKLEDMVKKKI